MVEGVVLLHGDPAQAAHQARLQKSRGTRSMRWWWWWWHWQEAGGRGAKQLACITSTAFPDPTCTVARLLFACIACNEARTPSRQARLAASGT